MSEWNSCIVPYNTSRKLAVKKFYDSKGAALTILSGKIIIKKIIFGKNQQFKKQLMLTSNFLTYYDLDIPTDTVVNEFSPLFVFDVKVSHVEEIVEVKNSECLSVHDVDEISFQLLTLDKKKINANFSVHLFYKFC